ncbi:WhiB family transcriptional regulator [Streptomyces sp. HNM0645]|uniref:WhiB family transcriptional regulator n=1 Tax=Streptomyces sp. HNM0645 TaxID=2782343 RepID=UPI0024B7BBFF|nr:WhiB family transcriptional regulator [Streptomyces sp. HNM0645]MDI9884756.1 WhiB family transcriptional regulator [Streptomyces sp. HNM0645]
MESGEHWRERAACSGTEADELFAEATQQNKAKAICATCPVQTECLAEALDTGVRFGVWGGMTERERRALLRRSPHVTSWRHALEAARRDHTRPRAG